MAGLVVEVKTDESGAVRGRLEWPAKCAACFSSPADKRPHSDEDNRNLDVTGVPYCDACEARLRRAAHVRDVCDGIGLLVGVAVLLGLAGWFLWAVVFTDTAFGRDMRNSGGAMATFAALVIIVAAMVVAFACVQVLRLLANLVMGRFPSRYGMPAVGFAYRLPGRIGIRFADDEYAAEFRGANERLVT